MRILVVGCGSIGRRHIRLLWETGTEVIGVDSDEFARERVGTEFKMPVYTNIADGLDRKPDGAIIATPPDLHLYTGISALTQYETWELLTVRGVLVEKPIATTLSDAARLDDEAKRWKTPLLVGYMLRYHPGLIRTKEIIDKGSLGKVRHATIWCGSYLPDWRPGTDYTKGYAAKQETGGGVLLDISHELDYANWLFGVPKRVMCMAKRSGALKIETEDIADVLIQYKSGVQVNIHLDYLRREPSRGCEIVGDKGTIRCSIIPPFVEHATAGDAELHRQYCGTIANGGEDGWQKWCKWEVDDMYRDELRHFTAVIRGKEQPRCTAKDGLLALKVALAAQESAQTGREITL